ncbi:MAG TPA: carboxypeptidase-like regulatory domain-containing protein, partial [Prolixibacteraceae bacterium]|nr:carboxypeptidase-like regulatory domain-containing protein [Prolixibacteraceae bacterium]
MKIVKFILVSLVFLCGSLYSNTFAQNQKNLTGTVVDGSKMPLPGVSVVVKGTTSGTITGNDGSYKISVADPDKAILVFSFI